MSLSSSDKILSETLFDNENFSFTKTYGTFILNKPYDKGFDLFYFDEDTRDAFIYKALSAASDDIGNTIYLNVKKYIDFVSNVDICKIDSLRSMLFMFGFKYTLFDSLKNLPKEIIDLMNVLSINKKILIKSGILKEECLNGMMHADGNYLNAEPVKYDDNLLNFRKYFSTNTYTLSASNGCLNSTTASIKKLNGLYLYLSKCLSDYAEYSEWILEEEFNTLSVAEVYKNDNGYMLADLSADLTFTLYSDKLEKLLAIDYNAIDNFLTANGSSALFNISDLTAESCDMEFISKNRYLNLNVIFRNLDFTEDITVIDDNDYAEYLSELYYNFMYQQLTTKYNAKFTENKRTIEHYVYPYIGDMYYDDSINTTRDVYTDIEDDGTGILSIKMFNHIPASFDEKKIVDNIDDGKDSLDNYTGAELSVINIEISRRAKPVDYNKIGVKDNTSKLLQTRYSYYREKKVAEYANFIDQYYSSTKLNASFYDFDWNYYVISSYNDIQHVISIFDASAPNPAKDIDTSMIKHVSDYLALLTIYICKIREKIKLQTLKNYMKGTNLLMIYIVNEYLIDYARHNMKFFLEKNADDTYKYPELLSIYNHLSAHQFSETAGDDYNIEIQEYYDLTEYFNLSTHTSISADTSKSLNYVNRRFWELTSIEHPYPMDYDGLSYDLSTLEHFYLSTLNLQLTIGNDKYAMIDFLSTIYDLGANDSFIFNLSNDSSLSIFSSMLTSKVFASDLFSRLIELSNAYNGLNDNYITDEYTYPDDTVDNLISNVEQTFIYKNLSDEYLSAVSAVYNKHIKDVDKLSSDVDALKTDYSDFISGTYSFYYKKSDCKYCYTDYDMIYGAYTHDYFIGNEAYVLLVPIYERLLALQKYSTSENIRNFPILDTVEYVISSFNNIYNVLRSDVINGLVADGSFVDIKALTLDNELQYTYDFLNKNIESRKEFLNLQLASLQSQANDLKAQYNNLNNTFTTAVASFNDNYTGYSLGDTTIHCVSFNVKGSWTGSTCWRGDEADVRKNKKGVNGWVVKINEFSTKIYAAEADSGDYALSDIILEKPYKADDPLQSKCEQVQCYMDTPTSFTVGSSGELTNPVKGLKSEGISTVVENIMQGLKDINATYENICNQALALFGLNTDFSAIDIYGKILALIEALTAIDLSTFNKDSIVSKYSGYLKKVINLSSEYMPVKQAYSNIFTDPAQVEFLAGYSPNMDLTEENVESLNKYTVNKDAENFENIINKINEFLDVRFSLIIDDKYKVEQEIFDDGVNIRTVGNYIEENIDNIKNGLINDVVEKTAKANNIINYHKSLVENYISIIKTEISSSLSTDVSFNSCVESKLNYLNFFEHDLYKNWKELFYTYGGRDFCYDLYYNMKNVTHPSYQVHPFLWNAVKKQDNLTLISQGFKSQIVSELIDGLSLKNILTFVGDFGLTINDLMMYSKGIVDYSGYITRWEMSEHISPDTGISNMIVDFEGTFYPPAVDDFKCNSTACISSTYSGISKVNIAIKADRILDDVVLSDYISYNKNTGKILSLNLYSLISAEVENYTISNNVNDNLNEYIKTATISSINMTDIKNVVNGSIPKTFYEKYYLHLSWPNTELQRAAMQMTEYHDDIISHTAYTHLKYLYDVYKYGLDQYKNSYILFKQYDYSGLEDVNELTFKQKRDTLGLIWIRLAHTPFAFPAFSGKHPVYMIDNMSYISTAIFKLMTLDEDNVVYFDKTKQQIVEVKDKMTYFYDFELTLDKKSIAYVTFNGKLPRDNDFYKQFEFSWVVTDSILTYYDKKNDLEYLTFKNNSSNDIDYIDFDPADGRPRAFQNIHYLTDKDAIKTGLRYPSLVGYYVYLNDRIDFVYFYKKYTLDDEGIYHQVVSNEDTDAIDVDEDYDKTPAFFVIRVKGGISSNTVPVESSKIMYSLINSRKIAEYDGSICVGYDKTRNFVTIAMTTYPDVPLSSIYTTETSESVDFDVNTDGALINDPLSYEMNSHDVFKQDITLIEYKRKTHDLVFVGQHDYNINADMSYIPSYPGLDNEAELYKKYKGQEYYNLELLGMSKDFDYLIKSVNPNPDPYFDYDSIQESTVFGRVYEDFVKEEDKSMKFLSNPSLNDNAPPSELEDNSDKSQYTIEELDNGDDYMYYKLTYYMQNLNEAIDYNERDFSNMKILIYNVDSLGKNPYYVGELKDFKKEIELCYDKQSDVVGEAEYKIRDVFDNDSNRITVTGTHCKPVMYGINDSNYIKNIDKIVGFFNLQNKTFELKFYFKKGSKFTFVPENSIKILFYNNNDMTLFKYYHMLDAYGVVNCKYLAEYIENPDKQFDGWGIVFDKNKYKQEDLSTLMKSYYIEKSGGKTYLEDIELSNYDYLSDVYILDGNKRLGFKYDEELRFDISNDMYYYPTLNISYPRKSADYFNSNNLFQSNDGNKSLLSGVFNDKNMFIIDLEDPIDVILSIGQIDIPILYNDINDIRVYEDYLSVDENGYNNFDKYDSGDTRLFQYAHFTTDAGISKTYTDKKLLEVPEKYWKNKSVESFLMNCITDLSNLQPMTSEELTSDVTSKYVSFVPTKDNCDLSKILKLNISYRRDSSDSLKLELFFNYYNYIDSPFIKIEDGTSVKLDTISGTYLKLAPDEDGMLDIIALFKYYVGNVLYGYKNVKICSYHIYNISDDKPKFLILKTYSIVKGSLTYNYNGIGTVNISITDYEIDLDSIPSNKSNLKIDVPIYVDITSDKQLSGKYSFYLDYPGNILEFNDTYGSGYAIDTKNSSNGLLHVNVTNSNVDNLRFNFRTRKTAAELTAIANKKFSIEAYDAEIADFEGKLCDISYNNATITVSKQISEAAKTFLAYHETENDGVETNIYAIIANNLKNLIRI